MSNELNIHPFDKELEFEKALCELLPKHGWSDNILHHSTEQELIDNWAGIIYDMNREMERLEILARMNLKSVCSIFQKRKKSVIV